MSLEREAEIEIFANGISANIALVDFRFPKCGRGRADSQELHCHFR
jgi:hypothetical protein